MTGSIVLIRIYPERNFEKPWKYTRKLDTGWCFEEPRVKGEITMGSHMISIHLSLLIWKRGRLIKSVAGTASISYLFSHANHTT